MICIYIYIYLHMYSLHPPALVWHFSGGIVTSWSKSSKSHPGTLKNNFFGGCFNDMIPDLYIKNGCFTISIHSKDSLFRIQLRWNLILSASESFFTSASSFSVSCRKDISWTTFTTKQRVTSLINGVMVYKHMFIFNATPWKINMEPENGALEDDFPFQTGDFLFPC